MALTLATLYVLPDEPCLRLKEVDLPHRGGNHRVQVVTVIRNDQPAEFSQDMGLSKQFHEAPFQILGGFVTPEGRGVIVHTVAELKHYADEWRTRPRDETPVKKLNVLASYANLMEERRTHGIGN